MCRGCFGGWGCLKDFGVSSAHCTESPDDYIDTTICSRKSDSLSVVSCRMCMPHCRPGGQNADLRIYLCGA